MAKINTHHFRDCKNKLIKLLFYEPKKKSVLNITNRKYFGNVEVGEAFQILIPFLFHYHIYLSNYIYSIKPSKHTPSESTIKALPFILCQRMLLKK